MLITNENLEKDIIKIKLFFKANKVITGNEYYELIKDNFIKSDKYNFLIGTSIVFEETCFHYSTSEGRPLFLTTDYRFLLNLGLYYSNHVKEAEGLNFGEYFLYNNGILVLNQARGVKISSYKYYNDKFKRMQVCDSKKLIEELPKVIIGFKEALERINYSLDVIRNNLNNTET